jgi:beta-N-acetylhexosaminidase
MILEKKIKIILIFSSIGILFTASYFILTGQKIKIEQNRQIIQTEEEKILKDLSLENRQIIQTEEEKILKDLSLEEKIGQLFIIGFEGENLTPEIENLLKTIHPGGVILFLRNIEDENQLKKLISDLQKISLEDNGLPLFVAIDQEGGLVRRIKWLNDETSQAEIRNTKEAFQIGLERGNGLKTLGINLNLAPVLDIAKEGDFLYNRSFRGSPAEIGILAQGLISGQKEADIFTAVKHFPGYGGISFNPETEIVPILEKTPEISQFQKAFEAKPELIMTANVIYSDIDKNLPFTFSSEGIQFLKNKIKDEYLIISDDLSSKILKEEFTLKNSVILAKKAGIDILLVAGWKQPEDPLEAFDAILEATKNGEIPEEKINKSVLKIIRLKQKISLEITDKVNQQKTESNEESATAPKESSQPLEKDNLDEPLNIINKLVNWGYEIPSQNRSIDTIIIHSAYDALGTNPYSVDGVIYEYKIYGVSPHYLIDREGTVFQLVKEENIAYHAGSGEMPDGRTDINSFSIGIELINTKTVSPNEVQYLSLVKLVKLIKSRYEIKYTLGHNEIGPERKTDPWNFDWQKFNSELVK